MVKKKPTVPEHGHLGGSGGATTFVGLTDTPASYVGSGGKTVAVKADASGLEFVTGGAGASSFVDLDDVPASYAGQGGKAVTVKADASGLEFTPPGAGVLEMQIFS